MKDLSSLGQFEHVENKSSSRTSKASTEVTPHFQSWETEDEIKLAEEIKTETKQNQIEWTVDGERK